MKKYRKSIWLPVALLVYTTAMAVYFYSAQYGNK